MDTETAARILSEEADLYLRIVQEELQAHLVSRTPAPLPTPHVEVRNEVSTPSVQVSAPTVEVTNQVAVPSVTVAAPHVEVRNEVSTPTVEIVNHVHPAPVINEVTSPAINLDVAALVRASDRLADVIRDALAQALERLELPCPPEPVKRDKRAFRVTHDDGTQSTIEEV